MKRLKPLFTAADIDALGLDPSFKMCLPGYKAPAITPVAPRFGCKRCFECGEPSDHDHHVVPEVRGGTKTVPLCSPCHSKAHHRNKNMASGALIKAGMDAARAKGVVIGRKPGSGKGTRIKVNRDQIEAILALRSNGQGIASIARITGLSRPTIYTIVAPK